MSVILVLCCFSAATTKIRLHQSPSAVAGYQAMDLSLGPNGNAVQTSITTTTSAGNDIQWTKTAGGSTLKWITPPLSSTTTISGTITFNFYAKESATSVNSTIRPTLILYHGGAETTTITDCGFATELTASIAAKNWSTASGGWTACSVTSTAIAAGDRIVLKAFVNGCTTTCTVAGGGMAAGSVTVDYDGPTDAADGSSWVQLNETETFSADGGTGGTPALVQWVSGGQTSGTFSVTGGGSYNLPLPNGAKSGNALIVGCYSRPSAGTITVTDDQSNTWSNGPTNVGTNFTLYTFYALNVASGTQLIHVSPANSVVAWLCSAYEFINVATASALDVSTGNHGTSASATAGSFTPAANGELLFQYFVQDGVWGADTNMTSLSTATQGTCAWSLATSDLWQVTGAQWCVQGTAAAINPTMTMNASKTFTSVALALVPSTAGTNATGMRVFGLQHTDSTNFGSCTGGSPCTATIQMPTQGNLLAIAYEGTTAMSLSSVSSSPANTWSLPAGCLVQIANGAQWVYAANATTSNTQTVTVTEASYGGAESVLIYDIIGAATSPFDSCVTDHSTGTILNHNDITPTSITPTKANGLVMSVIGVQGGTVASLTSPPANQNFMSVTFTGELGNNVPTDRNNGFVSYQNPSMAAVSFVYHAGDTTNWDGWATSQIAFEPPATTQGPGIRHK